MTFDIRQYILEQNDAHPLVEGYDVRDSEGNIGRIVSTTKTHATVHWENGNKDVIAHIELEQRGKYWHWEI